MPETAWSVADQPALSPSRPNGTAPERRPDAAGTRGCPAPPPARQALPLVRGTAQTDGNGHDGPSGAPGDSLAERVRAAADGLAPLVAQAEAVRAERARSQAWPRWTDVFTTQFTEFSNRPR